MLFADKRNLETNLQVSLLKIRDKELQFYVGNCIAMGTQSAVLAGFAYNGIIQVDIPDGANDWLRGAWLVTSCCAMGFEMICLVSTSFCVMFGPGLALRGPDGSMHLAVDGLMLEYRRAALFYGAGMSMFFLSLMLFAWLVFDWHAAVPMMIAMCFGAYDMYHYALRLIGKFHLRADEMVTGKFDVSR
mmetsp:Transcript_21833/g.51743  ORF Transcript_21833/g.51743 Transcript_21833/m.51743 type:complete len:188 (-) Transcript_21833:81-644(-)